MKTQKPLLPLGGGKEMGRPQRKLLAICVGAAFMPCIAGVAWADSAVGVDTASGNALNPPGRVTIPYLSAADSYDTVRRSPTGQLYGIPYAQPDPEAERTINGWLYSGNFEFGFLGGSPDAKYSKFREYKDLKKGLSLNYFDFAANNPDTANFIQVFGGGVGQNDQFYSLQFGHYNDWRVRAFYNETPHVFSDTFKPIYLLNGNHEKLNPLYGTDAYTNVGITGANPFLTSPVTQSLPADQEVSLIRKKAGMRADWTPSKSWRFYVNTTYEKRDGERPFGFMAVEGVEPIDYKTSDLMAGIQYFQGKTAVNLRASLSIFQDDIKQLYVDSPLVEREVPYPVGALNQIYTFIYTPPPNNKAASIKGDVLRRFDFWNSRFTGTVSWTTSRNNDSLRMPLNPGFLANDTAMAAGGTAADWNGVNGCPMSRCKSDLRVDSKLYLLGWTMDPTDDLTLRANARRYENDNKSPIFYAANPLLMGSPNATLYGVPFSGFFNTANAFSAPLNNLGAFTAAGPSYFSPPRSDTQTNYTLSGEYLFARKQALDLSYEREDFSHTYRERKETWEDKIKATYVNRGLFDDATLRTSWEVDKKRGSFYDPLVTTRPLASFMTLNGLPYSRDALKWMITNADTAAVLPSGIPVPTLAQMQTAILGNNGSGGQANGGDFMKIDQADRGQEVINTRLNWSVREDFDLGLSLQMQWIDYPHNNFGLQKNNQNSINLDANYQPSSSTQITAFYSRQK
ncbi:MAG: MtrB/PioB family outer membrane beta-barrel protein, partial [Azoarcus sp.]|nr:MtrB/PioB family outer membrane beta-barrel protein [Azoarcus sp.]